MVIVSVAGGLGNQMFQYAVGRHLATRHGVDLKLDLSNFDGGFDRRPRGLENFRRQFRLDQFHIVASEASEQEISTLRDRFFQRSIQASLVWRARRIAPRFLLPDTHFRERFYRFDPKVLSLPSHIYLEGFWQSEKYFADVGPLIRHELSPKDRKIQKYAQEYVDRLRSFGGQVISLHVRRGDLAHAHNRLKQQEMVYGAPISLGYIDAAIKKFTEPCQFLVFSDTRDDIEWCKQNIRGDRLSFCEGHSDVQDLTIMSLCDHQIIANSTFSWWAAWLNAKPGRRVVAPRQWSSPDASFRMVIDDLIPPDWETL